MATLGAGGDEMTLSENVDLGMQFEEFYKRVDISTSMDVISHNLNNCQWILMEISILMWK